MDEREQYCRTLRDVKKWKLPQYQKVLYSDASHFAVNQRKKKKVFRRRGRDPVTKKLYRNRLDKIHKRIPVKKVSYTIAVMVDGITSHRWLFYLVILTETTILRIS